jgi:hypothetical protein
MRRRALGTRVLGALLASVVAGCLSYDAFLEKKSNKYCEELAKCNPETPCEIPAGVDTGSPAEEDCDYDAGAARDCLNGVWTCDDRFPGFEYPVPAQACFAVCGGL